MREVQAEHDIGTSLLKNYYFCLGKIKIDYRNKFKNLPAALSNCKIPSGF